MSKIWKHYPIPLLGSRKTPYSKYKNSVRDDPCSYCGKQSEGIDHIVPKSAGGENTFHNLAGACSPCNSRKSSRPLLIFLLEELERKAQLRTAA
jgi:5-methylcytosine-specific restriction endonuclease McrA